MTTYLLHGGATSKDNLQNNHQGLGLLPIQTLCHWDVEKNQQKKLDLLKQESN